MIHFIPLKIFPLNQTTYRHLLMIKLYGINYSKQYSKMITFQGPELHFLTGMTLLFEFLVKP